MLSAYLMNGYINKQDSPAIHTAWPNKYLYYFFKPTTL